MVTGGRILTTTDLCARLPDVPKTTVYGQVGLRAEAGVLEVAGARGSGTPVLAEFSAYLDRADQPAPERHLHPVSPILCPIDPSQPHRAGI